MSNGFVLLSVLVFLQIFSLLGIYGLSSIVSAQKINQQFWKTETQLGIANNLRLDLERDILANKIECLKAIIPASELLKKTRMWWKENACIKWSGDNVYFYFVEFLGQDPCVVINNPNINQPVTAFFYRITLAYKNDQLRSPNIVFQTTIAKPGDQRALCPVNPRSVSIGVQFSHELY